MQKYVRTKSGAIWELVGNSYSKPNVINHVLPGDDSIIASADDIRDLIRPGDLVKFEAGSARVIQEKDLIDDNNTHVSSLLKIKEIYTQCEEHAPFYCQAYNHNGLWIVL